MTQRDDKKLGMDRSISRRDFVNGTAIAIGAAILPGCSNQDIAGEVSSAASDTTNLDPSYPPLKTGMRGAHPGSFEPAHNLVQGESWEATSLDEHYDLIVVGGGISGLSAAYIYRRDIDPDARILIMDNHDDFGGHAKRNEFVHDGKTLIGFGGTMLMESTGGYPQVSKDVVEEIGIEYERVDDFYQGDYFSKRGLGGSVFFDKETFGADHLTVGDLGSKEAIAATPLSDKGKAELERLLADTEDYLAGMSPEERRDVLETYSWRGYLLKYGGFGDEVLAYVQKRCHGVWAIGADAFPAIFAWWDGYPGFAGMDLGLGNDDEENAEEYRNFYFPDGNASVARMLVRNLIPSVSSASTMEDLAAAKFDYDALDRPDNQIRLRLSSIAVKMAHKGDVGESPVDVTYVRDGKAQTISASRVVWAGYHAMLPYICSELPDEQIAAMRSSVRAPLTYTNVLIKNWKSWEALGAHRAYCPGSFFQTVRITFPINIGDYEFAKSPDDPVILHLQHMPLAPGLNAPDQFRAGRQQLLETPFEVFERNARDQLGRMLGAGGFDPAEDILGITVNRWPHGYAYSNDPETGEVSWWPSQWKKANKPWEVARQRHGNIAIGGTDASSNAMTESAIEEAYRAVHSFST